MKTVWIVGILNILSSQDIKWTKQKLPILPCSKLFNLSIHQIPCEMPYKRFHFNKESYIFKDHKETSNSPKTKKIKRDAATISQHLRKFTNNKPMIANATTQDSCKIIKIMMITWCPRLIYIIGLINLSRTYKD